jgi:large subunit ribosomal protein L10
MPGRSQVRSEKIERAGQIRSLLVQHPVTALIGIRGVPASALQTMRRKLRARGHPLLVTPNSALRHALEAAVKERPALRPLLEHVRDQTALITTEGNPFALYRELSETRSPTPARGGAITPKDIFVPAGDTPFRPGPIVAELQHAGFPAAIEKGKVVLKRDTILVRAGEAISAEKANLLTRLGIYPLEVGLDLRAAVEGETFYAPDVLSVDLDRQRDELARAHRRALSVAVEIGYFTPASVPILLGRAHRGALALAIESAYPTAASVPELFARALRQGRAVEDLMRAPTS